MRKLLWILSAAMLMAMLGTPRNAKADGVPPPVCPTGSTTCKSK